MEDMWPGGKVCLKPTCVFLDEVVCCWKGKGGGGEGLAEALAAKCWLG